MAVSFRAATEDARGNVNSVVPEVPAGTVAGDLLLAVQVSDPDGSLSAMTAPSGWTQVASTSRSDVGYVKVWRKVATGSEPSFYTFVDSTSATSSIVIVALSGQDVTTPLAVTPTFANGSSSSTHPATSVTGVAGGMLLTAHVAGTAGTTRSYTGLPSGMTQAKQSTLSSSGYVLLGVNYLALAAAGATGSKIATCSASRPYITMSLVVQQPTALIVAPPSISSGEAFGSPAVGVAGESQTVTAVGIGTGEAFGSPTVTTVVSGGPFPGLGLFPGAGLFPGEAPPASGDQAVNAVAIDSAEAWGSPVVTTADGPQYVVASSIDSDETWPIPEVILDPIPPQTVETVGISSAEAWGRPTLTVEIPIPVVSGVWTDTYYINGVNLSTYAQQIEIAEGLMTTPGVVGDDVVLPGRDGAYPVFGTLGYPRRPDATGKITFNMWLLGVDPTTGEIPSGADTDQEWFDRWDELLRLVHRRSVVIDHPRPDGSIRRAVAHLLPDESIDPSRSAGSPRFGRLKATFVIPAAHWTDLLPITTGQMALTTNGYVDLSAFAAATAPCTELTVTFGEGNNPRLATNLGHLGWNGVITAGRQLGIDTATGQTHQASGAAWTPGYAALTYSPGPRLFEVDPSEPLQGILTHTTGVGVPMTVEIAGRRRYRTS